MCDGTDTNQSSPLSTATTTTTTTTSNNNYITIERTIPSTTPCTYITSNDNTNNNGTTTTNKDNNNNSSTKVLKLCVLGCEPNPPYGPNDHTARMIIELFEMAIVSKYNNSTATTTTRKKKDDTSTTTTTPTTTTNDTTTIRPIITSIVMDVYNVQEYQYPDNWNVYDGIIIPGSFSSAYDTDPWILQLQSIIQTIIVPNHYKTIAICFGHQIFAHSFGTGSSSSASGNSTNSTCSDNNNNYYYSDNNNTIGRACKTPTGSRAGRYEIEISSSSSSLLHDNNNNNSNNIFVQELEKIKQQHESKSSSDSTTTTNNLQLFVTHSDMVQQIPTSCATCIGGSTEVPIQIVLYYETTTLKDNEQQSNNNNNNNNTSKTTTTTTRPYAITMQGHPEYATTLGYTTSFVRCIDAMYSNELITKQQYEQAIQDSTTTTTMFQQVQHDSIIVFQITGTIFGWF